MTDSKKTLDEKCWKGYKKKGMKTMFGKRYPNCVKVKKEEFSDWRSEFEQIEEIDYDQVIEGSAGVLKDTIFPKKPKEKRMSASLLDNIRKVNTGAGSQYENVMLTYKSGQGFDAKLGGKSVRNTVKNIKTGVDAVKNIKKEKGIVKGIKKTINDKKTTNTKTDVSTNVGDAIKNFKTTISSSYDMTEKMDLKKADMGDVITDFRKSDAPQFKGKSDKKIQKMAIAAKLDAMEALDREDVPVIKGIVKKLEGASKKHKNQAVALKKAVEENTAIESELVIQDWNVDEIKYTEVEAVDIIKPEPLKPSPSNIVIDEGFKQRIIAKLGKNLIKKVGKVNPFTKTGAQRVTQGSNGVIKKVTPPFKVTGKEAAKMQRSKTGLDFPVDKVTSQNIQTQSVKNQAKKLVDMSKKPNKGTKAVKVDLSKPIDFDKYFGKTPNKIQKKFGSKKPTGTFTDDLPPVKNSKPKKPIKDHYDWRGQLETELDEDWQKVNRKDKTDGLSQKAVNAYRKENPGSKLKTAVTKDPKKLKKGSKSAKRRLSFCRRMKGMKKKLTSAKTRRDPDSRINKALRRWNC